MAGKRILASSGKRFFSPEKMEKAQNGILGHFSRFPGHFPPIFQVRPAKIHFSAIFMDLYEVHGMAILLPLPLLFLVLLLLLLLLLLLFRLAAEGRGGTFGLHCIESRGRVATGGVGRMTDGGDGGLRAV